MSDDNYRLLKLCCTLGLTFFYAMTMIRMIIREEMGKR